MTGSDITVCIPAIPVRAQVGNNLLARALDSVTAQHTQPDAVIIHQDVDRRGAAYNRDQTWTRATTKWVAFLDDDDEFYPWHLNALLTHAEHQEADLVYPWFDVAMGSDPFPQFEGQPWDDQVPHQVPITFLCRRELLEDLGGFDFPDFDPEATETDALGHRAGEDYRFVLRAVEAKARIVHLDKRTWRWWHHGKNTSGLPSRW